MTLIIDSTSGTMLPAHHCYLVPDEAFTEDEWEQIESFSDTEIGRIGRENGVAVDRSEQLLQAIADSLWGEGADTEWSPDTIDTIAEAIRTERPDLFTYRTWS
jgi:hypothetical protein